MAIRLQLKKNLSRETECETVNIRHKLNPRFTLLQPHHDSDYSATPAKTERKNKQGKVINCSIIS